MHQPSARTKLIFFIIIFLFLLVWVWAIHFSKPSSTPHNLKSSPTDGQLGTITQHLPFACFVHGISQDKDFNPHVRNPVTYEFSSSTHRKSRFHRLCLGASPRALLGFQLWLRAFTEGTVFQKGNPNCPNEHHLHFIPRSARAKQRGVRLLSLRGFPGPSREWSLPSFQHNLMPWCHSTQEKRHQASGI